MGFASKGEIRTLMLNTGLSNWTKISNWQRNKYITWFDPTWPKYDSGNSEWKGRFVALLLFNSRTYTSGGGTKVKPNVGFKLNKLTVRSKSYPNQIIDRELYNLVSNSDMLNYAYQNLKSKFSQMPLEITQETLDGISKKDIYYVSQLLSRELFTFTPSRMILVAKSSLGCKRLFVVSPLDKIVLEAIRLVLEAVYEPLFLNCSHGSRLNTGRLSALKQVSLGFQPAQWVIEGDFVNFLNLIPHR